MPPAAMAPPLSHGAIFDAYFDPAQIQILCVGTGMNTDSLMTEALRLKKEALRQGEPYERIWVVFDKDDFPQKNFARTFELAFTHSEITACWSNECFEIWYLLHFCYRDTAFPERKSSRKSPAERSGSMTKPIEAYSSN